MKIKTILRSLIVAAMMICLSACASKFFKYDKAAKLKEISEFDSSVKIVLPEEPKEADEEEESESSETAKASTTTVTTTTLPATAKKGAKAIPAKKAVVPVKKTDKKATAKPTRRQPEIESDLGFDGRRPIQDPYRVGEKVVHDVNYLKMTAGTLTLEVRPYAEVNGKRSYNLRTAIKSSSLFSSFYSINDHVTTLMDYETLVPSVFTLHVKESSQLKEARMFSDSEKNIATYWEKKVSEKKGEEEKKLQWEILPYSQNVFSAAFYLRNFKWDLGMEHSFRVAHDGKNLVFKGKALRKEKITTKVGTFDAVVIRPEFELEGKFKPTGENYIWLSDDDRKFILRIESKIKIGSLVSEIVQLDKGTP